MTIKKGDFIELDYTGKVKEDSKVFDTTIQKTAEEAGLMHKHGPNDKHDHSDQYSPITVCVGERQLLPGLDKKVEGLQPGTHKISLTPEEAFGKKSSKLLKMMPMKLFKEQNIKPFVGLELNIDNQIGTIRSVSGGRVIVDFNHPLANKEVEYEIDIKGKITDPEKQTKAILKLSGLKPKNVEHKDKKIRIKLENEIPQEYAQLLEKEMSRMTGTETKIDALEKQKPKTAKKEENKQ